MKTLFIIILSISLFSCSNDSEEVAGEKSLNNGNTSFTGKDYQTAYNHFKNSLNESKDSEIKFNATIGIAFSSLRLKNFDEALDYFNDGWILDSLNLDIRAGLSLLKYSYLKEFQNTLAISEQFLTNKSYTFYLDTSLNANDIILLRALAQFELKDFTECYNTIKDDLGKTLTFLNTDSELSKKLLTKLEELIDEYSN